MPELTIEEIKEISYHILKEVARFCEDNKITYFLACGTALGAIRHNGFIPWDDDIDIAMPREDYERFLRVYSSSKYKLCCIQNDSQYIYPFAKIIDPSTILIEKVEHPYRLGVYIDVFPIDGLPQDRKMLQKHLKRIEWDMRLISWKRISTEKKLNFSHKFIQSIAKVILFPIPISKLILRMDQDLKKYQYKSAKLVGHFVTRAVWGQDVKPKSIFNRPVKHRFVDADYNVPEDYDKYLKMEYGDYMKLPPEEKRVTHHDYIAYWAEEKRQ